MNHPIPDPALTRVPLSDALLQELRNALGDRVSTSRAVCDHHGRDESPFPVMAPDAVVFARSTEEVALVARLCHQFDTPLIPYGAGSSLEGNFLAAAGGISVDVSQMNQVLDIRAEDLTATVQAGVTRKQLNAAVRDTGLFFPIDPGADASLGGMCATRASGTNAVRYGTMRENALALTVVTADGRVLRTGTHARKSSAGYDLTRLFVGSEGTLGIITEVTVRLYPQPEAISAAICNFPSVDAAVQCVIQVIQLGVPVARVELVDENSIRAINAHDRLDLRVAPTLFFEFHGSPTGVEEQARTTQEIAHALGGQGFEWATRPEDRTRLWQARHNAYFACLQLRPGSRAVTTDVCVPISCLADCIAETRRDLDASSLTSAIVGHVGDGNFHVMMLIDPEQAAERDEAEAINARIVRRALDMRGTCTGEHGIGMHKIDFMEPEHGAEAIDVMRAIKRSLDPKGILNPGKIFRSPNP